MNLELAILIVLSGSPRALPAIRILPFLPASINREATLHEVEQALKSLQAKGHVKGRHNDDLGIVWKETDEGNLRTA